jgi:L-glyceraldehyde 3-phosphate reductase
MDRDGDLRPKAANRLGGSLGIHVLAASQRRPPAPDGDQREIKVVDQPTHPLEEIRITGEKDPLRAEDRVAERRATGPRRTGTGVLRVGRPDCHRAEGDLVIFLQLDGIEALKPGTEAAWRHDSGRAGKQAQRRLIQMVVVPVGDEHRVEVVDRNLVKRDGSPNLRDPVPQERIGQQPDPVELDEDRAVTDVLHTSHCAIVRRSMLAAMVYAPADDRYVQMQYRRSGRSGLLLPAISFGLWQNFGHDRPLETGRAILRRAFDLGITHFDLANNYGPPYGSAEENFGQIFRADLAPFRDELVLSTKAGYDMWPGPYGEWGSRKYLLSSLDQSLARMGVDYVDIFYSHRFDPQTPLEETMGALDASVRQGKALYVGISSYSAAKTAEAAAILRELGTPLLIHQPSYSMLNRWIEPDLLDTLDEIGVGCIVFSPLAQGMLTDKYLEGIPAGSRATRHSTLSPDLITDEARDKIRALNEIAAARGQTLAQMAIAWVLRDLRVTSALVGASSVEQLEANVRALDRLDFTEDELAEIDRYATESDINLWAASSRE